MAEEERIIVVTGAASGIGAATAEYLAKKGNRVIGVDLAGTEMVADLATIEGRQALIEGVCKLAPNGIDGIVANAGVFRTNSLSLRVNYFGAVATLEGLRPQLRDAAPRAVLVSSRAVLQPVDEEVVEACLSGDEDFATTLADKKLTGEIFYPTSKRAVARWMRRAAPSEQWAGAGIPLNAVGPGSVETPMTDGHRSPEAQAEVMKARPMPLGGTAQPEEIAPAIGFFLSPENTKVTGQLLMVDGGGETLMRGDNIWT